MFEKTSMYLFTFVTLAMAVILNYFFPFAGFWIFFLLPMFGVILLYPKWSTGHLCLLIMIAIRYTTEYATFSGNIPPGFFSRLFTTSFAAWIILIVVTFFILEMNQLFNKHQHLSLIDNLTQSYNRRYLEMYSEKLFADCKNKKQPLSVLMFDIDHFKLINDTYGHTTGDMVLKKLTFLIQNSIRETDTLVRIGGEEFILLMPGTLRQSAEATAEKIRKKIELNAFEEKGAQIPVTISIGLLQYTDESLDLVIEKVDKALYQAKHNGRNQVSVFVS